MRSLTPFEQECAESLAFQLADFMCTSMPTLFGEPPESVVSFTLPFACALVRAEAKAARHQKHAKRYRRLQREVQEILRTEPDSLARLGQTVPFDATAWHTVLAPGPSRVALAGE